MTVRLVLVALLAVLFATAQDSSKQTYTYKSAGGCEIKLDVIRPPDDRVRPVIFWIHGGALIMGNRGGINAEQLRRYIEAGFVVVSIDYRLAPETKLPEILEDVRDAHQWIRANAQKLRIDADRLAVVGHSAGGYLTLMTGTLLSPAPKALVSFYGYGDIAGEWYSRPDPYYSSQPSVPETEARGAVGTACISEPSGPNTRGRFYLYCRQHGIWPKEVTGRDPDAEPRAFDAWCPVLNVTRRYPPTLLLHGDKDTDVPYRQSAMMAEELKRQGVEHELITIPGGGHGFDRAMKTPEVSAVFDRAVQFLRKQLTNAQPRRFSPPTTDAQLKLYTDHPRLVFRPTGGRGLGRTFEDVRKLHRSDATFQSIFNRALSSETESRWRHPAMLASFWIVTGEDRYAEAAIEAMLNGKISSSGGGGYSNIWSYALAYDWLFGHPALTPERRERITGKIAERLESELRGLDQTGMALWHGRNQAANGAIVAALALGDLPGQENNLRRAVAHYIVALRALDFSEGWPEGASYWIYNRAGPYAVAADCFLTALGTDTIEGVSIRQVMRKIGLWSIYQFTPAQFFEPYGDSSGSLRLGETGWWELSVDYYAKLSRDPGVMAGADYLRNLSPAPYGKRPYQWYVAISYDPSARPKKGYDPAKPELWMRKNLPQAMLFGRGSLGVAFFRGAWGDPDELYATFKAGDLLAHHDHYDTGHFSIQRGGLLAPQTGLYGPGGYTGPHRLGYAVQTVSANSLLVLAPGETAAALRSQKELSVTSLSGGQRVIRPTGFDCYNLDHFKDMLASGPRLERADITAFESVPGQFDYVAADITAAYNSTRWAEAGNDSKVSLVTRQFLYLRPEEAFVVYDRVETTKETYLAKFLLHSLAKSQTDSEKLLAGNGADDGILETQDRRIVTAHHRGVLTQIVLLPVKARTLKIGGPNFNCYTETDGDQSDGFDGVNLEGGDPAQPRPTAQLGSWRTEVEPTEPGTTVRFLNVLLPRLEGDKRPLPTVELVDRGPAVYGVRVGNTIVTFAREAKAVAEGAVTTKLPTGEKWIRLEGRGGG